MLIIAEDNSLTSAMVAKHDAKFDESQRIRIEAMSALNEAGKALIRIQEKFRLAKAGDGGMIETDLGPFQNFDDYLLRGSTIKKTHAYDCIKLAKNWHIVVKLGMQDTTNSKTLQKSMRLCRRYQSSAPSMQQLSGLHLSPRGLHAFYGSGSPGQLVVDCRDR